MTQGGCFTRGEADVCHLGCETHIHVGKRPYDVSFNRGRNCFNHVGKRPYDMSFNHVGKRPSDDVGKRPNKLLFHRGLPTPRRSDYDEVSGVSPLIP